ncbi:MAG: hypothetical protein J7K40_11090 [candidate division Zixibacteria bacterium]|nr:hypothetical protein [candidate division Zixibacteria bacterium]
MLLLAAASAAIAQTYQIDWYVIGSGGGSSSSESYSVDGTIGQPIVGQTSSENYIVEAGFWVGSGAGPSGYEYLPGDVNMANGLWPPLVIGGDVTFLVNYFKGLPASQPCLLDGFWASADANGDCIVIGSDVIRLVNYFRGAGEIEYCPSYLPAYPPLPPSAPSGWPNCEIPPAADKVVPVRNSN